MKENQPYSNLQDVQKEIDEGFAEGWRPEVGDMIVGVVTDISSYEGKFQDIVPVITIERDDGTKVAVHCYHTVLKNRILELKPNIGETIGIKKTEIKELEEGKRSIHIYNVKVKGRGIADPYANMGTSTRPGFREQAPPQSKTPLVDSAEAEEDDDIPF